MVRNEAKYEQAVQFRKRGFTYVEIAKICEVSKATVSNWLAGQDFSKQIKAQNKIRASKENAKRLALMQKARSGERKARYQEAVRSAEVEYRHYKKDPLFMIGLGIYLSAGDRTDGHKIRLSTGRLDSQRLFIKFATLYLGVDKAAIRFWLLLYPDQPEVSCMRKWSRAIGVSVGQFHKTQIVPGTTKRKQLQFGVGNTIIGNTVLKQKLDRWIELAAKEL